MSSSSCPGSIRTRWRSWRRTGCWSSPASGSGRRSSGARYLAIEIEYGAFERRIELGEDVDAEAATARYDRGMLKIVLPVAQRKARQGKVPVDVGRSEARAMSEPEYQVAVSADEQQRAEELGHELPATLPVLPLKETVVFPESMTPLAIGQERSIQLIDDVVGGDRLLALVTVRNEEADVPAWDDLYEVGTAAVVHKMIRVPDGTMRILVQGLRRVRLERRVLDDPYLVGEFVEVPDRLEETKEVEALTRNVQSFFGQIVALVPYLPEELQIAAANVDDPSALCHLVASTIRLKTEEKQKLLELVDVEVRLREVLLILNREQEMFELGTQDPVAGPIRARQGPARVLPAPAAEGDPGRARRSRIRSRPRSPSCARDSRRSTCPRTSRRQPCASSARLERLPSAAAEYGVIRTYLDWIVTLPWNTTTTDNLDLDAARTRCSTRTTTTSRR